MFGKLRISGRSVLIGLIVIFIVLGAAGLFVSAGTVADLASDGGSESDDSAVAVQSTAEASPTEAAAEGPNFRPVLTYPEVTRALITTSDLNVRMGPGTNHGVLGRLQSGDVVPIAGRAEGLRWLGLPGIGWVAYEESWIQLPIPFAELPVISNPMQAFDFVGPLHPVGTLSGIPVVDVVVSAFILGDREAVLALVPAPEPAAEPEAEATTEADEASGDDADAQANSEAAGDAGGTGSDSAAATEEAASGDDAAAGADGTGESCVDATQSSAGLDQDLDRLLTRQVLGDGAALNLYAVIRGTANDDGDPDYVVVLAFEGAEGRQLWVSPSGEITRYRIDCEPSLPGAMLLIDNAEPFFWLRPPVNAPVRALP